MAKVDTAPNVMGRGKGRGRGWTDWVSDLSLALDTGKMYVHFAEYKL